MMISLNLALNMLEALPCCVFVHGQGSCGRILRALRCFVSSLRAVLVGAGFGLVIGSCRVGKITPRSARNYPIF